MSRKLPPDVDKAAEIIADAGRVAAERIAFEYEWGASKCQSPIERMLLAQFLHPDTGAEWDMPRCDVLTPPSGSIEHVAAPPIEGFFLWPQIQIGPYRVDFVIGHSRPGERPEYVIVECDGHDFHEKTKEQAQRDKARDRYIAGRGFRVLRFTGSEIFNGPQSVLNEIFMVLLGLCDD